MQFQELTDKQRDAIKPHIPKPAGTGRPHSNDRMILDGIICVLASGYGWSEMPKTCGDGSTANPRLRRWQEFGTWKKILGRAIKSAHKSGRIDLQKTSIDSSSVPSKKGAIL